VSMQLMKAVDPTHSHKGRNICHRETPKVAPACRQAGGDLFFLNVSKDCFVVALLAMTIVTPYVCLETSLLNSGQSGMALHT